MFLSSSSAGYEKYILSLFNYVQRISRRNWTTKPITEQDSNTFADRWTEFAGNTRTADRIFSKFTQSHISA